MKNIKMFTIGLIVGVVMMLGTFAFADAPQIAATIRADFGVSLNGHAVTLANSPAVIDGHMYLPIKDIAEATGLDVTWNDKTQTAELSTKTAVPPQSNDGTVGNNGSGGTMMNITIDSNYLGADASAPAILVDGVRYLPVRDGGERYGFKLPDITFDSVNKTYNFKGHTTIIHVQTIDTANAEAFIKDGVSYVREDLFTAN